MPLKRCFPTGSMTSGIAEQHAVTFAAGMAAQGMRPVVAMYSTFLQRAYDQVVHDVATQNLPVTFCIDRGGLVAEDGTTHHGAFDYAFLRHVPNMVVMAPKDENELQHMMKTSVQYDGACLGAVSARRESRACRWIRSRRPCRSARANCCVKAPMSRSSRSGSRYGRRSRRPSGWSRKGFPPRWSMRVL